MVPENTSVLIIGAGPAGLAAAIELGSRNVRCIVVERNDRVGYAPRAKTTHVRTREHFRRWGIAHKLAEASPFGIDYPTTVHFITRLAGYPLHKIENSFYCDPKKTDLYSEHAQWIPQYKLEEVLRAHAQSLPGVDIRFDCEFQVCSQDENGVRSTLKNLKTGDEFQIDSEYLIGADGARSKVRDIIGAKLEGVYGLSRNYNIVFKAPGLAEAHPHGPGNMYWQVNTDAPSLIGPMDTGDRWFFMPTGLAGDRKLSNEEAVDLIKRATGIDLPYEVLSSDEWVASRFIADKCREGRVFLAGDACHLHPPFGGFGMILGIADAIDAGWKIAAVLQGWAGPALLDSYALERRPMHDQVVNEAVKNHSVLSNELVREGLEDDTPEGAAAREALGKVIAETKTREFRALGIVKGYRLENSPVIAYGAETDPQPLSLEYAPSAAPGRVAPHIWLADGRSLYDLFGVGFTLLAVGDVSAGELNAVRIDAASTGTPLDIIDPDDDRLPALYEARLTLIRPDQHVAWRGDKWPGPQLLRQVTGRMQGSMAFPGRTADAMEKAS